MNHRIGSRAFAIVAVLSMLASALGVPTQRALAAADCENPPNEIVAENCLPGNPASEWDVAGAGDASIQGFATDISVDQGPEFYLALADEDNFGQIEIDESALTVQYMLEQGYTSENQIGVNGCSYGGYLVNQSITQYPNLYAAATSQCSIMDMADYWKTNPYLVTFYEGSVPEGQPEEYRRDSPLYSADAVRTPVLLIQGTEDFLPVKLVREFRKAVEATETPVELLVFKNEGHSLTLPSSKLFAAQQQIAWFRKYLSP